MKSLIKPETHIKTGFHNIRQYSFCYIILSVLNKHFCFHTSVIHSHFLLLLLFYFLLYKQNEWIRDRVQLMVLDPPYKRMSRLSQVRKKVQDRETESWGFMLHSFLSLFFIIYLSIGQLDLLDYIGLFNLF